MSDKCLNQSAPRVRGAFTLIELLVVVAIIMMLAGLLFPAFSYVRETARKTKAKADVKQLDTAWRALLSDYRTWSAASLSQGNYDMDAAKVNVLRGTNPKGVIYMEFDGSSTNAAGAFVDPWYNSTKAPGNIFRVGLGDLSGTITPFGGITVYRDIGVWSKGRDGVEGTKDDVKSWE